MIILGTALSPMKYVPGPLLNLDREQGYNTYITLYIISTSYIFIPTYSFPEEGGRGTLSPGPPFSQDPLSMSSLSSDMLIACGKHNPLNQTTSNDPLIGEITVQCTHIMFYNYYGKGTIITKS